MIPETDVVIPKGETTTFLFRIAKKPKGWWIFDTDTDTGWLNTYFSNMGKVLSAMNQNEWYVIRVQPFDNFYFSDWIVRFNDALAKMFPDYTFEFNDLHLGDVSFMSQSITEIGWTWPWENQLPEGYEQPQGTNTTPAPIPTAGSTQINSTYLIIGGVALLALMALTRR